MTAITLGYILAFLGALCIIGGLVRRQGTPRWSFVAIGVVVLALGLGLAFPQFVADLFQAAKDYGTMRK